MQPNVKTSSALTQTFTDFKGQRMDLADYQGRKHVVLVFNRGFM